MLRLAHKIATSDCELPLTGDDESFARRAALMRVHRSHIENGLPVVVADNVAEYIASFGPRHQVGLRDCPGAMPPFEKLFVEWSELCFKDRFSVGDMSHPSAAGALCVTEPGTEAKAKNRLQGPALDATPDDGALLMMGLWLQVSGRSPVFPSVVARVALDRNGDCLQWDIGSDNWGTVPASEWMSYFIVALLTISFMNCKNVSLDEAAELRPSKKRLKRDGGLSLRYYSLAIDPMKKVLAVSGSSGDGELKKALHICRGHFATYSDERPLFGRLSGRFWKPSHVRGSLEHGAVMKDYEVRSPPRH